MSELKEIEITFKVKVATYKAKEFVKIQQDMLKSYMGRTYEIIGGDGIIDDGKLIISGEER
jgi:hypothetical protein